MAGASVRKSRLAAAAWLAVVLAGWMSVAWGAFEMHRLGHETGATAAAIGVGFPVAVIATGMLFLAIRAITIVAALLGVNQWSWCLLILGGSLVLLAELCHSAIDTLARAIGDPDEPRLTIAREIAAAGVLVVAFTSGAVTVIVLSWKLTQQLGWAP